MKYFVESNRGRPSVISIFSSYNISHLSASEAGVCCEQYSSSVFRQTKRPKKKKWPKEWSKVFTLAGKIQFLEEELLRKYVLIQGNAPLQLFPDVPQ